jgi:hypothetical protein
MYPTPIKDKTFVDIDETRYFPTEENFIEGTETDDFMYKLVCGDYVITYEFSPGEYDDCMGEMGEDKILVYWEGVLGDDSYHEIRIVHNYYVETSMRPHLYWEPVEGDSSSHTLSIYDIYWYWDYKKIDHEYLPSPNIYVDTTAGGPPQFNDRGIAKIGTVPNYENADDSSWVIVPVEPW